MLRSHLAGIERTLLSQGQQAAIAGHTNHKGTAREAFIRDFLSQHLASTLDIGTGEIIDANSKPGGERRPQCDIVIFKRQYPRLHLGGGVHAFLAESVVATIEVKSLLDSQGILQAVGAAHKVKALQRSIVRSFHSGFIAPSILSYVVAYSGPGASGVTLARTWIEKAHRELGIASAPLPLDDTQRLATPSPSLDGVFLLGTGYLYFDNVPIGAANQESREKSPKASWVGGSSESDNLFMLFLFLTAAGCNIDGSFLNPLPYTANVPVSSAFLP